MKKIFVVSCEFKNMPNCYVKAESKDAAMHAFSEGFRDEVLRGYTSHPSFQVRELTMELLDDLTPDEFQTVGDAGF